MSLRTYCCTIVMCALLLPLRASAAEHAAASHDRPQWRGPNRDGISLETGLSSDWEARPPKLLWKTPGLGEGFSSVSVADGRIYTMGDRDGQQHAYALDAASGKLLWSTTIGAKWKDSGYTGPRCTPTVDGDRVYVLGTHGDLVCLDAATGRVRWSKNLQKDFGGKMMSGWGYSESPLIDGNRLICTPGARDAMLVTLDKLSGDELWRTAMPELGEKGKDGAAYSSIVISEACGVKQYVQLVGRGVIGVDADDGKFLWGYNRVANRTANIPTPIVAGDYVFCSTGYQTGSALLKLNRTAAGGIDAEEIYFLDSRTLQNHHGGLILIGDYIYGGTGHNAGFPICVKLSDGRVVWHGGRGPGSGSAAVTYADGHLYFRYQDGIMALIEATPEGYRVKGTFAIPDSERPSWPHPAIADGKLYVREQDQLLCYDVRAASE